MSEEAIVRVIRNESHWTDSSDIFTVEYASGVTRSYHQKDVPPSVVAFLKSIPYASLRWNENHAPTMTGWQFVSE